MGYTPFDNERLLIAHVLTYPEAAKIAVPLLPASVFVYSKEGMLGATRDHMKIWQAIVLTYMSKKMTPTVASVMQSLDGDYKSYLDSLVTMLGGYYRVYDYDPMYFSCLTSDVDKAGNLYRAGERSSKVGKMIESPEEFSKALGQIEDIDAWLGEYVRTLSSPLQGKVEGYRPASVVGFELREMMAKWQRGESNYLLPVGLPSIEATGLYRAGGHLVIHHGRSQSGKSAWTHLVNLGTAIGLKNAGIKGCVAVNSMEENQHSLMLKLGGILSGVQTNLLKFGGGLSPEDYQRLEDAVRYIETLPIFIESNNLIKTGALGARLNGLHGSEFGPVWMMSVDYLELLIREERSRENKEQMVEGAARACHDYSRDTGACVMLISQSTQGDGKSQVAGVDGARYSKAVYMTADAQAEVWNPIYMKSAGIIFDVPAGLNDSQPWLLIQKDKEMGLENSRIPLGWEPKFRRFFDPVLPSYQLFSHHITYNFHEEEAWAEEEVGF